MNSSCWCSWIQIILTWFLLGSPLWMTRADNGNQTDRVPADAQPLSTRDIGLSWNQTDLQLYNVQQWRLEAKGSEAQDNKVMITGFYHVALMGNWAKLASEQLRLLDKSGLLRGSSRKLVVGVVGESNAEKKFMDLVNSLNLTHAHKIKVGLTRDSAMYEWVTLNTLRRHCQKHLTDPETAPKHLVYYLHTKGVTHNMATQEGRRVQYWRRYMEAFLFEEPSLCLAALGDKGHLTCGVNFKSNSHVAPHYQGNFWWARCDHVARLPPVMSPADCKKQHGPVPNRGKLCAELWIASYGFRGQEHCAMNLWHSKAYLYKHDYPRDRYEQGLVQMAAAASSNRTLSHAVPPCDISTKFLKMVHGGG